MVQERAKKAYKGRRKKIDDTVKAMTVGVKKKAVVEKKKNPYKAGSASAKYWQRRQDEGTKMKKKK